MEKGKKVRILHYFEFLLRVLLLIAVFLILKGKCSSAALTGILILFVIDLLLSVFTLNFTFKPLIEIEKIANAIDNGLEVSETVFKKKNAHWKNNETLNKLFLYIEKILQANYNAQILKSQAEIHALQSQINPHFLYNTLETIRSQAVIKGVDSIEEMTEALADIFQYSISRPGEMTTIRAELENISKYLLIQQYRFPDKFQYKKIIEEENLLDCRIPVLTLQPLVENAIHHGLEMKIGTGTVTLRVTGTEDRVIVVVSDDGLGMSEARLDELNQALDSDDNGLGKSSSSGRSHSGIALLNVHRRIRFYFGREYGLRLYSAENVGTSITLTLPKNAASLEGMQ